ncbi:molecular chaperone [Oceanicola sp. 502str15]|uniref:fimbrial biogenesis chaperone n=1 Tax=Oceanicola sp. 502str15 TaxID=2696061 RepID=UPI00209528EF|nr:fimbria/pilus periplasmic chaperone [Oceanicola sp. 502str15]
MAGMLSAGGSGAIAQSLTVSPTKLEAPGAQQTTVTVKADGRGTSIVQLRVVAWREGTDPNKVKPTRNVVISPPVVKLKPRQELTARVVRTKKRKVRGRECYRVLIDRLPGIEQNDQAIKLQVRHSVPLCFS